MVFLFASYLLGHFSFLLGSRLDEWVYDPLRKCTGWGQIRRLAAGRGLASRRWRAVAESNWFFGGNGDAAVTQAERIKARALHALSADGAINAYQWCKARLSKDHPEGLVAVQRFEADSKFFRSFVVVLAGLALVYAVQLRAVPALVCAGFLLPALWRYAEQRFKATQQAYWLAITLEGMKDASVPAAAPEKRPDGLTHAGGVVFRMHDGTIEYLLVQASKDRSQWVLPKGHIEPGEKPHETAVREVREETGCWARVVGRMHDVRLTDAGADSAVACFFRMELAEDEAEKGRAWLAENRRHRWLPLAEARQLASFADTRQLLDEAEARRTSPGDRAGQSSA